MLIQFSFKNYKSFKEEANLDMSAAKMTEFNDRVVAIGGDKILPIAAIYGANASGKSNILDSLFFLSRLAAGYSVDDCARRIRGGEEWICRMGTTSFTLKAKVHNDDTDTDYYYEVEVTRNDGKFEINFVL